jgi:hypothetical protein
VKHQFSAFAILAVSVLGALAPEVKADEWNKKTNITINQPVEVQGAVLSAGSYILELADLSSNRHIVQILSAEDNRVIATMFTVSAFRLVPADKSAFKFYDSETGRPHELHTWFLPGETIGFEFKASREAPAVELAKGDNAVVANVFGN